MKLGCTNISVLYNHCWQATECCPFLGLHFALRKKESRNAYADFMLKRQHVGSPTMNLLHTGYLCSY